MSEILLETNKGIVFEKVTTKNRCRVTVKNKDDGFTHMVYRFNKEVEPLSSQYISWGNLNCCGGWACDESYLLTAVQEGKKLCSGIMFNSENELDNYRNGLSDDYKYFCRPPMTNGSNTFYYIDVVRDGAIRDFIDESKIFATYDKLRKDGLNRELLTQLLTVPMYYFINGETFDYRKPLRAEEWIITGLMLGYPLESTAWLLEKHQIPATKL